MYTYTHTHIHVYIYTHTHTYICIHTYTIYTHIVFLSHFKTCNSETDKVNESHLIKCCQVVVPEATEESDNTETAP